MPDLSPPPEPVQPASQSGGPPPSPPGAIQEPVIEAIIEKSVDKPQQTTEQVLPPKKKFIPNPTGKGGFGDNPDHRNPGGRIPKREWTFKERLEQFGETIEPKSGKRYCELGVWRLWIEFINGNMKAAHEVIDRMDGGVLRSTDITSLGEKLESITVTVVEDKKNE